LILVARWEKKWDLVGLVGSSGSSKVSERKVGDVVCNHSFWKPGCVVMSRMEGEC